MIEDIGSMEPAEKDQKPKAAERLEQFEQANASLGLEGMQVDEQDKAIQARVASGELTTEEAIDLYLDRVLKG